MHAHTPDRDSTLNVAPSNRSSSASAGLGVRPPKTGLAAFLLALPLMHLGCAGAQRTDHDPTVAATTNPAGTRTDRLADSPTTAIVWVNGMGCPLCATNVDQQLRRVPGVTSVAINLGTGMVTVGVDAAQPPAESALAQAVRDSGFTLVGIQMPGQAPVGDGGVGTAGPGGGA